MASNHVPQGATRRGAAPVLAAAFAAAAGLWAAYACSGAEQPGPASTANKLDRSPEIEIPKFGRPEQAKQYFKAMTDGDRRAIEALDEVIEQAKLNPQTEPRQMADLVRERGSRAARLQAYTEALQGLPP